MTTSTIEQHNERTVTFTFDQMRYYGLPAEPISDVEVISDNIVSVNETHHTCVMTFRLPPSSPNASAPNEAFRVRYSVCNTYDYCCEAEEPFFGNGTVTATIVQRTAKMIDVYA
jgi:hypothetical protein